MIFPEEYKNIGFIHSKKANAHDKHFVYFLSQFLIEEDPDGGLSVYCVRHDGSDLLRSVAGVVCIASSSEVVRFDKPLNIKNRSLLIETAAKVCEAENKKNRSVNTVVFIGFDRHITFVHKPEVSEILDIQVIDIRPPDPPRLLECIERLCVANIFGDLNIRFSKKIADLVCYEGPNTVFPCSASGLVGKCLDTDTIDKDGSLLVGCHMSKRIFELRFPGLKYDFVDLCPMYSELTRPEMPFIMRCCQTKNTGKIIYINGFPGIVVHWGASEYAISQAVRKLAEYISDAKSLHDVA